MANLARCYLILLEIFLSLFKLAKYQLSKSWIFLMEKRQEFAFDGMSIRSSDLKKVRDIRIDSFINMVDFERYIANISMNL